MPRPNCLLRLQLHEAVPILKVLANERRCQILEAVTKQSMSISELANEVGLDQATVSQHVQMLEKVNLVRATYVAATRGQAKVVQPAVDNILLHLPTVDETPEEIQETEMPIGLYTSIDAVSPCGFATASHIVYPTDNPSIFHHPKRSEAENLWIKDGEIEYVFPYTLTADYRPIQLEVSVEICSEVQHYNEDFPSEVTLWVNGVEIGTVLLSGDMGARYGRYTPDWVPVDYTKYGFLTTWSAGENGFFLNQQFEGPPGNIDTLELEPGKAVSVKFGFKEESVHGGINLFGKHYGDYDQAIKLRIIGAPLQSPAERLLSEFREILSGDD